MNFNEFGVGAAQPQHTIIVNQQSLIITMSFIISLLYNNVLVTMCVYHSLILTTFKFVIKLKYIYCTL
jgi:hypothetical protein